YTDAKSGIDGDTCGVVVATQEQSSDMAQGVDKSYEVQHGEARDEFDETGAGDQGMMIGYACRETDELMPMPIAVSHRLAKRLADVRRAGILPYLRPDGKSQVTIVYEDRKPVRVHTVVISAQHREEVDIATLLAPAIESDVVCPNRLEDVVSEMFDFRPAAIIERLDLRRPIYLETAAYGHFGRKGFSWEETDRVDDLRRAFE